MTERQTRAGVTLTATTAVERLRAFANERPRTIVGLCGPPGAGKSTLAAHLVFAIGSDLATLLPMDGFHLANATLDRLDLRHRKGAIDTFDVGGYSNMLHRLAVNRESVIYAPEFDRQRDEAVAGAVAIGRDVPLVLVEGNYLLADAPEWAQARAHIDEIWYLEVDEVLRRKRLVDRHMRYGRSQKQAEEWMLTVDEINAQMISRTAHRADAIIGDFGVAGSGAGSPW